MMLKRKIPFNSIDPLKKFLSKSSYCLARDDALDTHHIYGEKKIMNHCSTFVYFIIESCSNKKTLEKSSASIHK